MDAGPIGPLRLRHWPANRINDLYAEETRTWLKDQYGTEDKEYLRLVLADIQTRIEEIEYYDQFRIVKRTGRRFGPKWQFPRRPGKLL